MYDRNGKSERILTQLHADISEYVCERNIKFRWKIFLDSGFIHWNIPVSNSLQRWAYS